MENERMRRRERAVVIEGPAAGSDDASVSQPSASSSTQRRSPWRPELPVGGGNTMRKLMLREVGGMSGRRPPRPDAAFCAETFRRFKLQEEFLVHTDRDLWPWMAKDITRIIPANDFIFVMDSNGYCVAFHYTANASIIPYKKDGGIWYFNYYGEVIRDLYYNKINDSVITVSSTVHGHKTRAFPLESIRRCDDLGDGIPLFGARTNNFPLFDFCNNLAVVSKYQDQCFVNNIYEIKNYALVHSIPGDIQSITPRPGIMIVAYQLIHNELPIKVFSTKNWTVLEEFSYCAPPRKTLQFIELCHEHLFVKEDHQKLQVINIWNHANVTTIENSEHMSLLLDFDLIANNILLEFENGLVVTCNSRGEQVPLLEDAPNGSGCSITHLDTARDNNIAVLYSRRSIENPSEGIQNSQASSTGTINICSTINGKPIVEVNPCDDNLDVEAATRRDNRVSEAQRCAHKALKNVTVIFYDDDRHRIYTGNSSGYFHVWSN